jgi:hypothetical protein
MRLTPPVGFASDVASRIVWNGQVAVPLPVIATAWLT